MKERGHYEEGIVPFFVDGKQVYRCPITFITNLTWEYLRAYSFYDKNCFPNGTAWIKESKRYLTAMMILSNAYGKAQKRRLDGEHRPKHKFKA